MTIKEAILKSLEDFPNGGIAKDVFNNILQNKIFVFNKDAKTPYATVHAIMGEMIKNGDVRIKRFKNEKNIYCYYLSHYAKNIEHKYETSLSKSEKTSNFLERSLHPLLCSYLNYMGVMAKTIFHEKSTKDEEHQKWVHPDIVGAKFVLRTNKTSNSLFNAISKKDSLKLYSYELKRSINNDYELKKCFFQAVSNSSWANNGYLVAFEINKELKDELARLNHSFGIGFILLKSNPYESQMWFKAKEKTLDFNTIDKLCNINPDFEKFIRYIEATLTADDKHFEPTKKALISICDTFLTSESDIKDYCKKYNIPTLKNDLKD
jgi:hypothetical protein